MNRLIATAILVLTVAAIAASAPPAVHAQKNKDPAPIPCFTFTDAKGKKIGKPICNLQANDLKVDFNPGTTCFIQFTTNATNNGPQVNCPPGVNDVEVFWGPNAAGVLVIISCTWTFNEVPQNLPCPVPQPPAASANDFHFFSSGGITAVIWTHDGTPIGKILPPKGAFDVDFFFFVPKK